MAHVRMSRNRQHNLADVLAGFHPLMGGGGVSQRKRAINGNGHLTALQQRQHSLFDRLRDLTDEELADVYPWEDWILARSMVGMPDDGELETDMFAGIRTSVAS